MMHDIYDLRSLLEAQQANICCTIQTQAILSSIPAVSQRPLQSPAWTQIAHPYYYPNIPECCCDDGSLSRPKKTNCRNCGAPVTRSGFCEYCDTYN